MSNGEGESKEIRSMRYMAWERAKGEMRSMLATFWGSNNSSHDKLDEAMKEFIAKIESEGLHE